MTNYIIYKDGCKEEITCFAKDGENTRFTTQSGRFIYIPSGVPAYFLKEEIVVHHNGTVKSAMIIYNHIDIISLRTDVTFEYRIGPIHGEVTVPEDSDIELVQEAVFQDAMAQLSRFAIHFRQKVMDA